MNAIVEVLTQPKKTKPPLEIQVAELKRQMALKRQEVRDLKAELKQERRHSTDMLGIMRRMSHRSIVCECDVCTCTPTRAEMLRR